MIRIGTQNIYLLRNSTGKPFTDLLDRLIRSSAATLGIPPSAVLDNPRTNYPDGGVDTQVTVGAQSDPRGYFNGPSTWQFKAVALNDFNDSKVRGEISGRTKEYVRSLLREHYAYRLCIADDGPAERKTEIKAMLDAEIKKINCDAPESIVLFASEVTDWVNAFPAIAAEMLGSSTKDFFHFATWQNRERAVTRIFVPTSESAVIFENVKSHLAWENKRTTARLTVSGDAGVGKSRTVFEAIAALPEVAPLTLYTDDEDNALEVARAMANHKELYAVLVADECLDTTAFQLAKILQGVEHRVRLITIDNALERSNTAELRLSRMLDSTVEKIVEANFPNIDQSRRYRYCRIAEGYLRFAIFLCDNDDLIVEQGHLGQLLSDTKSYLATLFGGAGPFGAADFVALKVIALVERCGVTGNVFAELEQLCALAKLDPKDVRERLHRMQKANGLVSRAGRYFYVTPTPIAVVCFQSAWSTWAELDPKSFLENFPAGLVPSFLSRMARAPEEVGKVVNAYFRNWELSRGGDIFANADDTKQLLLLVRSSPDQMVPRLHSLVLASNPEQLGAQYGGGRRSLISEASEIAAFPEWFVFAEDILFKLAIYESEPGLGNNATEAWCGLFPIMAYLATPFAERLKIIRKRSQTSDAAVLTLCVSALRSALNDQSIRIVSSQPYGARIAPTPWHPKTYGELYDYMKSCLGELSALSLNPDGGVRERAADALIQCIRRLASRGLTKEVREGAGNIPAHVRPVLRAELRELALLTKHNQSSEKEQETETQSIDDWIQELSSADLHDRLVEEVGPDSWDHHLEQVEWEGRTAELAAYLLQHQRDFEEELSWLNSDKARSSAEFGAQVGRLDSELILLDQIVAACLENRSPKLARGYFIGVSENTQPKLPADNAKLVRKKLNASLDALWTEDPVLAFNVMAPAGDFVESFDRAIAGLREKKIPASFLRTFAAWNGPRHTQPREARQAMQALLDAAREGDEDAASTGIDFIVFLLMRNESDEKLEWLQRVFSDDYLDVIYGLLEQATLKKRKLSHWFSQVFARVLPANPDRATSVLILMMQSESYEISEAAAGLFIAVSKLRPQKLLDGIGEVMLSRASPVFLFRKFPIASLPEDVLIRWLEANGLDGARAVARHVPGPFIGNNGPDLNPVTRFILENYGGDDIVFASWAAGMSGGPSAGSVADHVERRAAMAEPFLTFPIEAVRRWARGEVLFANENAENFRLSEEELF